MPWKVSFVMEERIRFVARLLDGEAMTDLGHEFGISRKTGYKIVERYKEMGPVGLADRSRRPLRFAPHDGHPYRPAMIRKTIVLYALQGTIIIIA